MSLFVSFTLTPMLCSRFLKLEKAENGHASSKSGWVYIVVERFYGACLRWSLRHRWITIGVCMLIVLSTVPIAMNVGVNLVPRDDQSEFQVGFITPEGYTLDRTNQVVTEIENRLAKLPALCTDLLPLVNRGPQKDRET